ncbi:hypothetical protein D3C72_183750 [compost metagenome]
MGWYNAGTVTATNNSGTITGAGTAFISNIRVGDGITVAGSTSLHEVTNIVSETQLTVSPVYGGTTGASKTYAVVPVQGYVQGLADQAKNVILTFGNVAASSSVNALMTVTGAADRLPYFTSGTTMATTGITALARSLLDDGSVTSMRSTLGLKTAAVYDVVGAISSGGIIERGANANGEYTKFADGTLICWFYQTISANLATTGYGSGAYNSYNWTFPVAFAAIPALAVQAVIAGRIIFCGQTTGITASSCGCFFWDAYGPAVAPMYTRWLAIGRWF